MNSNQELIFNEIHLAEIIKQGSAALFPTDTLPALGVSPNNANKIWELKQRPFEKPLILMGATKEELFENVLSCALEDAFLVAIKYWPGPLTMVVPASGSIVQSLNKEDSTIGIRIPSLDNAFKLLKLTGPLATTSANISGATAAKNAVEASSIFPELPLLGPIPWPLQPGLASTVISWQSQNKWKVLRSGPYPLDSNWEI